MRSQFLSWIKEPDSISKIATAALINSVWLLLVLFLWHYGFFFTWKSFFQLFRHPGGFFLFLVLVLSPGFNLTVLGYFNRYARSLFNDGNSLLPPWDDPVALLKHGAETFLVFLVVFFPCLLCGILGLLFLMTMAGAGGVGYIGHSFLAVLLFSVAVILAFFLWLILPITYFRFLEGGEVLWAVRPREILEDVQGMGSFYWRGIISFTLGLAAAEVLLLILCNLLALSPLGGLISGMVWVFLSSWVFTTLSLYAIKVNALSYSQLRYHY